MYLLLLILWLIFNGRITVEILLFGLGLTALIGLLIHTLWGYGPKKELRYYRCALLFLAYIGALILEILKANAVMIRLLLSPRMKIDPVLVRVRVDLRTRMGRYILANSITLTPGTITVLSDGDTLTIHCLRREMMEDLENGTLIRLLRRMEAK